MKVLIADFDKFSRTVYESELHQQNIEVEVADNGEDAFNLAKKNKPDLVITELILPRLNGFELIKKLKSDKKLRDVPVVAATELMQQSDYDLAISLGVEKYLPKDRYSQKQVIEEVLSAIISKQYEAK